MAAGEREQVLADFQACTQLDDIETCIAILDQHDWNLVKAINSVMHDNQMDSPIAGDHIQFSSLLRPPGEPNFFTTGIFSDPVPLRENNIADSMAHFDPGSASGPGPSGTGNTPRMLHFNVEYRERNVNVYVADSEPVARIKEILEAELDIPVGKQELRGWTNRKVYDNKILRELHLPKENTLFLLTPEISQPTVSKPLPSSSALSSEDDSSSKMFRLNVIFKEGNGVDKSYPLRFEGSDTVRQVKESVATVTDVPVRHQIWTGWPDAAKKNDSIKLAVCSLSQPYHTLELSKANVFSKKKPTKPTDVMDLENSEDEIVSESYSMDDESDLFLSEEALIRKKLQPLMPESVNDEMEALEHFTREFRERYGECHPVFYVGSLDNAIKDSLMCKAKDRKMLAIYLHHDGSILSNVFCSQILCSEGVVNYLTSNFTVWAWDMTHETNSDRLFTMATRHFGSVVATQVRGYQPDDLPVLLIITRSRSAIEVVDVVRGNEDIDGLMTHLIQDYEVFREQQKAEIVEEAEREARERILQEQNAAYKASLEADRKKLEAQREEERRRQEDEERERKKRRDEEKRQSKEKAHKQALQDSLARAMPKEPPEDCSLPTSVLRIRTPKRDMLTRRFLATDKLKMVFNYIVTQGYHMEEYKVLTTFPRRDLSQLDSDKTLEELKLYPQETLILEERT